LIPEGPGSKGPWCSPVRIQPGIIVGSSLRLRSGEASADEQRRVSEETHRPGFEIPAAWPGRKSLWPHFHSNGSSLVSPAPRKCHRASRTFKGHNNLYKFLDFCWRRSRQGGILIARKGGPVFLAGIGLMCIGAVFGMSFMFNPTADASSGTLLMFIMIFAGLILCIVGLRKRIS
jgi:hypothetical protein